MGWADTLFQERRAQAAAYLQGWVEAGGRGGLSTFVLAPKACSPSGREIHAGPGSRRRVVLGTSHPVQDHLGTVLRPRRIIGFTDIFPSVSPTSDWYTLITARTAGFCSGRQQSFALQFPSSLHKPPSPLHPGKTQGRMAGGFSAHLGKRSSSP